jgi:hypothetical protein
LTVIVSVDLTINEAAFSASGLNVLLTYNLKNHGHTPAFHVSVHPLLLLEAGPDNRRVQQQMCSETTAQSGLTIFSGIATTVTLPLNASTQQVNRESETKVVTPTIIGFVEYRSNRDDDVHRTGFIYCVHMSPSGAPHIYGQVPMVLGQICRDRLKLLPADWEGGGFFAT